MVRWLWAVVCLVGLVGCPHPQHARMDALGEPDAFELAAKERIEGRTCPPAIGVIYPGIGALCDGRTAEGVGMIATTTVDVGATAGVLLANPGPGGTGKSLPPLWIQNDYIVGWVRPALDRHVAKSRPYAPRDELGELLIAPFNGHVLKRPVVWAGTIGLIGGAIAVTALSNELFGATVAPRAGVNWFGADLPPGVGWPAVALTEAYTFEHVAVGEETLFRGLIQSSLARGMGPWGGWAVGSLIFGSVHAMNAAALPPDQVVPYLAIAVPYITLAGAVMGLAYMDARYSLTASVAMHFWYDLALAMASTIADPDNSYVAVRIRAPF